MQMNFPLFEPKVSNFINLFDRHLHSSQPNFQCELE